MGWAEEIESIPPPVSAESQWATELDSTPEQEIEEDKPFHETVFQIAEATPHIIEETYDSITGTYGAITSEATRAVAAGLYKASGDLMTLGAAGLETVYDAARIPGRELYKAVRGAEELEKGLEPWAETDYLSRNLRETVERDVPKIAGEQGALGRYTQKIAEYAGLTQAVARQMLARGAALLKEPALVSSNVIKKQLDKSMMAAAKNPEAAIKLEQGVSAMVATVGQTAKELGVSPEAQLVTELVTGLASGQILNTSKSIINSIGKKVPGSAAKIGKIQAAEYLQEVAKNDPNFMKKLERGLNLQSETGIEMDLAQLTNNPELKAALQLMEVHTAGTITGLESRLAEQTKSVKKLFPAVESYKESAVKGIDDYQSEIEIALERQASKTVDDVLDQVDNAAPLDKEQLGETGRNALDSSREAMEVEVNQLYKEVGNPSIPTNVLVKALNEAKKSPLKNDKYLKELDAEIISTLEANLLGRTEGTLKTYGTVKPFALGRAPDKIPQEISLDGMRLIESRLKERIRIANAAGKGNESRLLTKILGGVFDQYKNVPAAEAHQISNLRKAASASKRLHEIFDQGEVLLQSKVDVRGMERITTEGFVRNFIKANSDSKLARTNEAVDGFYNAYGDIPEARQWFVNAFGALLKEEIAKHGDKLRPKQIRNFINKHSSFLKRAKIEGQFDSIEKAVTEANAASDVLVLSQKEFKKTVMSKFIGTDDPVSFVLNAAESGALKTLSKEVSRIPNKQRRKIVERGIKEALWEGVKRRLTTTEVASGEEIVLNTSQVRNMLDDINYGKQLKEGLGDTHYASLKKLMDTVDRISPDLSKTAGLPKEHIDEKLVEKLMTGLRAAAHGFVRPDLIAAQMSMRGYKAITTKQAHKILKEAMANPEFAKELLRMSTTIKGKEVVGTMFSPLVPAVISDKQ